MGRQYYSEAGDKLDSEFEVLIVNYLIEHEVPYETHPQALQYSRPVRAGYCIDCDSDNVRKGALYTPDVYLPETQVFLELKGGSFTQASRGRLADFIRTKEEGVDLRFIFRDNAKIRGTKKRKAEWCEAHGVPVHIGPTVPEDWYTPSTMKRWKPIYRRPGNE